MSELQRETKLFHLLIHFPNSHNCQSWARLKSGVRNSIWISHMGDKGPNIWSILRTAFPGTLQGTRSEVEQPEHELVPIWGADTAEIGRAHV